METRAGVERKPAAGALCARQGRLAALQDSHDIHAQIEAA
jgi:hypothetical protein